MRSDNRTAGQLRPIKNNTEFLQSMQKVLYSLSAARQKVICTATVEDFWCRAGSKVLAKAG